MFLQENEGLRVYKWAAAIMFSVERHKLWPVGDCKYAFDWFDFDSESEIDSHAASVRAAYKRALLISGKNTEDLKSNDEGRGVIVPILEMQHHFLNRAGAYPS